MVDELVVKSELKMAVQMDDLLEYLMEWSLVARKENRKGNLKAKQLAHKKV